MELNSSTFERRFDGWAGPLVRRPGIFISGMALILGVLLTGCAAKQVKAPMDHSLAVLAVAPHRLPSNIARNAYRHPVETLEFFGIEQDMTVLEALPGGSLWYAEILAPFLKDNGRYIVADYDLELPDQPKYRTEGRKKMVSRFESQPDIFGAPQFVKLTAPQSVDLGPKSSVDAVLTFRSTHGWQRDGAAEQVYAAFFEVLKPGGVLGVVQHRAGAKTDLDAFTGYVSEERLVKIAEGVGFQLEARSEVNANPKDRADYPKGVWTLPPVLRNGDQDRERYLAIGESDRMTLRFRKPE